MSDTPRTDAQEDAVNGTVLCGFSRQLERELNEANRELDNWITKNNRLTKERDQWREVAQRFAACDAWYRDDTRDAEFQKVIAAYEALEKEN